MSSKSKQLEESKQKRTQAWEYHLQNVEDLNSRVRVFLETGIYFEPEEDAFRTGKFKLMTNSDLTKYLRRISKTEPRTSVLVRRESKRTYDYKNNKWSDVETFWTVTLRKLVRNAPLLAALTIGALPYPDKYFYNLDTRTPLQVSNNMTMRTFIFCGDVGKKILKTWLNTIHNMPECRAAMYLEPLETPNDSFADQYIT